METSTIEVLNLRQISDTVTERYKNFTIETVNNSCLRMSVNHGLYNWHVHDNSDELFIVLEGELQIELPDSRVFALKPFDFLKMPKGAIHRTYSETRTVNLVYELIDMKTHFLKTIDDRKVSGEFVVKNLKNIGKAIEDDYKNFVLEEINDDVIRLGINHGIYDWHCHPNSDELFLGIENRVQIEFKGIKTVKFEPLEIVKLPRGLVHRTIASERKVSITFESRLTETVNL